MTLSLRAATSGCLDFTYANSRSQKWLNRERAVLAHVEQQLFEGILRLRFDQATAGIAVWPEADPQGKMHSAFVEKANERVAQIGRLVLPHMPWTREAKYSKAGEEWRAEFISRFGDPDDPKVAAEFQRLSESFATESATARAEADAQSRADQQRRDLAAKRVAERGKTWKDRIRHE